MMALYQVCSNYAPVSKLALPLFTCFLIFEATSMKFGPCVQFWKQISMVCFDDIDYDILTYFLIFVTSAMQFGLSVQFCKQISILTLTGDLLNYFLNFEATAMIFGPCAQVWKQISMLSFDDLWKVQQWNLDHVYSFTNKYCLWITLTMIFRHSFLFLKSN